MYHLTTKVERIKSRLQTVNM